MYAQDIIFSFHCKRYGIIQIFRVLTVDRNHLPVSQIFSSGTVRLAHFFSHAHSLIQHLLGKFCPDSVIHNNGKNIRSGIIDMPDNFNDSPFRFRVFPAIGRQFHNNLMPGHCSHFFPGRYIYVVQVSRIIRPDKSEISALLIQADDLADRMRKDPDDLSFPPSPGRRGRYDILHLIPLESSKHIILRDKYILSSILGRDKSKSPAVSLENPFIMFSMAFAVLPSLGKRNFSFLNKSIEYLLQLISLFSRNL